MKQKEFGDFQTHEYLAEKVVKLLAQKIITPDIVIEPTCGKGSFISASYNEWGKKSKYFGSINKGICQKRRD